MLTFRHTAKAIAATITVAATVALPAAAQAHGKPMSSRVMHLSAARSGGASAATASDHFSYTDQLLEHGRAIGSDHADCTRSDPIYFTCNLTISLHGGTLKVSVPSHDSSDTVSGEIYGGTGRYSGASGDLTITSTQKKTARYTIVLAG